MTMERSWDVTPIVKNVAPDRIHQDLEDVVKEIEKFTEHAKEAVEAAHPESLLQLIQKAEQLNVKVDDLTTYCFLKYMACTTDKENGQLYNWSQSAESRIESAMIPLEIRFGKLVLENPHLLESPVLYDYRHYMERLKRKAPYRLSDAEETLIAAKDVHGVKMMSQLQESWVSAKAFDVEVKGEKKTLTLPALSSLRMDPDRSVREMASRTLYKSYGDDKMLHGFALRSICADHVTISKKRRMPSPMTQSLVDQDVDESTVRALLDTIEKTSDKFQAFLKIKAKYMGLEKLAGYDVIAPWTQKQSWSFEWPRARELVIDSFRSFDKELGDAVEDMFVGKRIDSSLRKGKANTAFCASWDGGKKAYVLINYTDMINDLYVLAHENGHAAQDYLLFKNQSKFNRRLSSCVAETGSIFGELLLTEKLLSMCENDEQRIEILSTVLGNFYYTVYYVGTRALFEETLYDTILNDELLDADKASELWDTAKTRIFGDAVDWSEYMEFEWARIPHFFFAGYRFYNYSYSFAQMLVFALYEAYKTGGPDFNERFKALLGAGSSESPRQQIADFGYDITDSGFWALGSKQADGLLEELRKIV